MNQIVISVLSFLLLGLPFSSGAPAPGSVFLSGRAADNILQRHKRHNSGLFEEWFEGNLEKECREEVCDLEEARETFENDEKTMEFWAGYSDGNQCQSNPCLNQGSCKDNLGFYTCTCTNEFTGRNCEIALIKRCDVNNGDCMHFCDSVGTFGAKCSCARGYRLMPDGSNCEPEVEFPCGRTALTEVNRAHRRSLLHSVNISLQTNTSTPTSTPSALTGTTESYLPTNESKVKLPTWMFNTGFKFREKVRKRIVGGEVVTPGEIPWQVALVATPSGQLFCGGSILSELWVITAAHCLEQGQDNFVIRVGEHNIHVSEGTEQDYEVLKQHIHPRYNATLSLYNHDIALLCLKRPIAFSALVRPICIGPKEFSEALVMVSSPATVSGWGRTRFQGSTAVSLHKVEVPFTDRTECKLSSSSRITPYMFCAGYYDEAKDACQGDSGGPHANSLHDTWFLTGLVSWGEECAKEGKYGVYTRVSLYYRWINHVMGVTSHRLMVDTEERDL